MFLLLENAEVHAPEPLGRVQVLIAGSRIGWIGGALPDWPRAIPLERRDLGGATLIPGLVDGHAHVTGGGGESGPESKVPPVPLSRFTAAGVTSVVGLLGTDDTTRSTSELVTRTRALRAEGLSAWCWTGGYHLPPRTFSGCVRSDIAHLDVVLGAGEIALSDHRSSQPTFDELVRLAADCHVGGLLTGKAGVLHLHLGDGKRGLELVRRALEETELPARVFHPTHVNRRRALFDEALELARRGCVIDVTAYPVAKGDDAWSAADALERFWSAGVPRERITVSSDGGGCLPTFDGDGRIVHMDVGSPAALIEALGELVRRGHPWAEALAPFTSNVARHLRLPGKGRIAVGADADLVALDRQGRIREVFALGTSHVSDGRQLVRGSFEA